MNTHEDTIDIIHRS